MIKAHDALKDATDEININQYDVSNELKRHNHHFWYSLKHKGKPPIAVYCHAVRFVEGELWIMHPGDTKTLISSKGYFDKFPSGGSESLKQFNDWVKSQGGKLVFISRDGIESWF